MDIQRSHVVAIGAGGLGPRRYISMCNGSGTYPKWFKRNLGIPAYALYSAAIVNGEAADNSVEGGYARQKRIKKHIATVSSAISQHFHNVSSIGVGKRLFMVIGVSPIVIVILYITAFVYGAIVGSFLNVCIIRIPRRESVLYPPSHCACGKRIRWYDNLPIISWVLLRGCARCCGGRISAMYPLVELVVACLWLLGMHVILTQNPYLSVPVAIVLAIGCPLLIFALGVKFRIFSGH